MKMATYMRAYEEGSCGSLALRDWLGWADSRLLKKEALLGKNILLVGDPASGKSHIANALLHIRAGVGSVASLEVRNDLSYIPSRMAKFVRVAGERHQEEPLTKEAVSVLGFAALCEENAYRSVLIDDLCSETTGLLFKPTTANGVCTVATLTSDTERRAYRVLRGYWSNGVVLAERDFATDLVKSVDYVVFLSKKGNRLYTVRGFIGAAL